MQRKTKEVNFSATAASSISSNPSLRTSFNKAIRALAENPLLGTKLKGELREFRRFRVGKFRIVYYFTENTLEIVNIADRKDVYR